VTSDKAKVLLDWELNCDFGWGILGLNVFSHWANDPDITPLSGKPIANHQLGLLDPLRVSSISNAIVLSNHCIETLGIGRPGSMQFDGTVIHPVGHGTPPSPISGTRNIGRCIFENTNISPFDGWLGKYDVLLCASNWNADVLRKRTKRDVRVIFEGIDPSLFCPGPRSGLMNPERFYIFSGGKVEFRKAQDLVLLAFREFSRRHADAILVAAWHSPWPQWAAGYKGRLDTALELDANGQLDVKKWVADNGIDPGKVVEIFRIPNQLMPAILREMDVAIQPSRAEACTSLPVKEAMACGVAVIVGENTGMKDLIKEGICVPLRTQGKVPGADSEMLGWGESDVGEIVETLEMLYRDHRRRRRIGSEAAVWIREHRTWQNHAHELKKLVLSLA